MNFKSFFEAINYDYEIPEDKEQMMYEFYLMSALPEPKKDDLQWSLYDARLKLYTNLKKEMLDAVIFAISAEFRHIFDNNDQEALRTFYTSIGAYDFIKKYQIAYTTAEQKLLGKEDLPKIRKEQSDKEEYNNAYKAFKATGISKAEFARIAFKSFLTNSQTDQDYIKSKKISDTDTHLKWRSSYGGKPWAMIADGWLWLDRTDPRQFGPITIALDHIYDLQHNTDTVFNKCKTYYKSNEGYSWIKKALDFKANSKSLYDLFPKVSPTLKNFAARVIYDAKGETYEAFLRQSAKIDKDTESVQPEAISLAANDIKDEDLYTGSDPKEFMIYLKFEHLSKYREKMNAIDIFVKHVLDIATKDNFMFQGWQNFNKDMSTYGINGKQPIAAFGILYKDKAKALEIINQALKTYKEELKSNYTVFKNIYVTPNPNGYNTITHYMKHYADNSSENKNVFVYFYFNGDISKFSLGKLGSDAIDEIHAKYPGDKGDKILSWQNFDSVTIKSEGILNSPLVLGFKIKFSVFSKFTETFERFFKNNEYSKNNDIVYLSKYSIPEKPNDNINVIDVFKNNHKEIMENLKNAAAINAVYDKTKKAADKTNAPQHNIQAMFILYDDVANLANIYDDIRNKFKLYNDIEYGMMNIPIIGISYLEKDYDEMTVAIDEVHSTINKKYKNTFLNSIAIPIGNISVTKAFDANLKEILIGLDVYDKYEHLLNNGTNNNKKYADSFDTNIAVFIKGYDEFGFKEIQTKLNKKLKSVFELYGTDLVGHDIVSYTASGEPSISGIRCTVQSKGDILNISQLDDIISNVMGNITTAKLKFTATNEAGVLPKIFEKNKLNILTMLGFDVNKPKPKQNTSKLDIGVVIFAKMDKQSAVSDILNAVNDIRLEYNNIFGTDKYSDNVAYQDIAPAMYTNKKIITQSLLGLRCGINADTGFTYVKLTEILFAHGISDWISIKFNIAENVAGIIPEVFKSNVDEIMAHFDKIKTDRKSTDNHIKKYSYLFLWPTTEDQVKYKEFIDTLKNLKNTDNQFEYSFIQFDYPLFVCKFPTDYEDLHNKVQAKLQPLDQAGVVKLITSKITTETSIDKVFNTVKSEVKDIIDEYIKEMKI